MSVAEVTVDESKQEIVGEGSLKRGPRRPKFKHEEKLYLVKLVEGKKSILESKVTSRDLKDITRKAAAWKDLATQFNSGCIHAQIQRTPDELKRKWVNLKEEAKKQAAARKREMTKTGGGKAKLEPTDEVLLVVEGVIKGAMTPLKSEYDSDSSDTPIIDLTEEQRYGETESQEEAPPSSAVSGPTPAPTSSSASVQLTPQIKRTSSSGIKRSPACIGSEQEGANKQMQMGRTYEDRQKELHDYRIGMLAQQQMFAAERHQLWVRAMETYIKKLEEYNGTVNPGAAGRGVSILPGAPLAPPLDLGDYTDVESVELTEL